MVAMPERIRFHLDEHVSHAVAAGLRRRGLDITTAVEIGLRAASDEEQLAFAFSQGRVLVTHDRDLLMLASQGQSHAGMSSCDLSRRPVGDLIRALLLLWEQLPTFS
jgi:predicted nuclease of predicted toxin-antitoxin system